MLDPFGGSGVTIVESLMNGRKGISIDINPFAVFLVNSLMAPVKLSELAQAYERVKTKYLKLEPDSETKIALALESYPYPIGLALPYGSDVQTVEQLFNNKQLAQLATLKFIIKQEKDSNIRASLMLMFSGLLTKANLTYHTTPSKPKAGQGDAAAFRYYRYRIAPQHVPIDIMYYFDLRYNKVTSAKKEIQHYINTQTISNAQVRKGTATDLSWLPKESIDYIYTDPPYGKKIPYLDLSTMWNAWLDLDVSDEDYMHEAIMGGRNQKSKQNYNELIARSIKEMYRVLKFDRWMSFVFAHKDPEFWHLIIETAEDAGFEYVGAVPQKNGQTSFKKRQNPFTVLSGQLIINFRKIRKPRAILRANLGMNILEIIVQTIEGIIAKNDGATLEQINDELIVKGLELGFLDLLKKEYTDLTPLLIDNFEYDNQRGRFTIKKNEKFKTNVDVKLRIRYYTISFLTRKERESYFPTFDEIILHIIPLLKNGITPENQTILGVLQDIAEQIGDERWRLKKSGQLTMF